MRVRIDYACISDAPYCKQKHGLFAFDGEEDIEQIEQELLHSTPTCFLVSGYRGCGKTSYIKRIESDLSDQEDLLFVHLNVLNSSDPAILLRKLIRELYLVINEPSGEKVKNRLNEKILRDLTLLFKRTFNEIVHQTEDTTKLSVTATTSRELNVKTVIAVALIIAAITNSFYEFINNVNTVLLSTSGLLLLSNLNLDDIKDIFSSKKETAANSTSLVTINEKEFYDDEIAEHHLGSLLTQCQEQRVRLVFVLDELDKIEDDQTLEELISQLKPLMLSGLASFIVISGQHLFYKYRKAEMTDDPIVSNVFSRLIHVSLPSTSSLERVFTNLLADKTKIEGDLRYYLDSVILRSNRLPRKFLNIIRQDCSWEMGGAYIDIQDVDVAGYKTDKQLLDIVSTFENIQNEYDLAMRDFFTVQIYLWIHRAKLKRGVLFTADEIMDCERYYSSNHPQQYLPLLTGLCTDLLDKLVTAGLLLKESKHIKNDQKEYYRWRQDIAIREDTAAGDAELSSSRILVRIADLEEFIKSIYQEVFRRNNFDGLDNMLEELRHERIISQRWRTNHGIERVLQLRNKLAHNAQLKSSDLDAVQELSFTISSFKADLLTGYTRHVIGRHMAAKGYTLAEIDAPSAHAYEFDLPSDFVISPVGSAGPRIFFEVKTSGNTNMLRSILQNVAQKFLNARCDDYYVIFLYSRNTSQSKMIEDKFNQMLDKELHEFKNRIFVFQPSIDRAAAHADKLEMYVDRVIRNIGR